MIAGVRGDEEHFDAARFDAEIEAHGTQALWRKARTCPCRLEHTDQPDPTCPFCVEGIIWDAGTPVKILATARKRRDHYDVAGMWMGGMITLTFPSTVTPGHYDRFNLLNAEMVVNNERHTRGEVDRLGRSKERLRLDPVSAEAIEYCEAIEGDTLRSYVQPADFSMGEDAVINWAGGHGPGEGVEYTLRYRARPAYVVWSPQSRDEGGTRLQYRADAQRLDFFKPRVVGGADG